MRVLLVEDAVDLAEATQGQFARNGIACDLAMTVADARACLAVQPYDVIVLDINLPDGNGTDLLQDIRRQGHLVPVLMLTAQFSVDDKVSAFSLGADDYLVKPFDYRELEARIHAMLRREASDKSGDIILANLTFNPTSGTAQVGSERLNLTRREFALLSMLIRHRDQVFSKDRILDGLYSFEDTVVGVNAIELYVARLRKKLTGSGVSITTHRGLGYQLDVQT